MLRFRDKRTIASADELTPIEREQLRVAGQRYDGEDLPAETRLVPVGPDDYMEGSFAGSCTLWRIVDGDRHVYDAWFYMGDSGTFFVAGTSDDVAAVIQCGLQCDDRVLRLLLGPGMVDAGLLPRADSSYNEFAAELAGENGRVIAEPMERAELAVRPRQGQRAETVAERPSAKRKTSAKAKKPTKKSKTRASTRKPLSRKRKKPMTRRR